MHGPADRRTFVSALASLAGVALVPPLPAGAAAPSTALPGSEWDLSWLDRLTGKHKQVFAVGPLRDHFPLHVVVNYLDAHKEVFGLSYPDVNTVVGIARQGFPINVRDGIWAKYELGRRWELKDPDTGEWSQRNIYLENVPSPLGKVVGVKPLQARGAIFWQCNNALNGIVADLARDTHQEAAAVR